MKTLGIILVSIAVVAILVGVLYFGVCKLKKGKKVATKVVTDKDGNATKVVFNPRTKDKVVFVLAKTDNDTTKGKLVHFIDKSGSHVFVNKKDIIDGATAFVDEDGKVVIVKSGWKLEGKKLTSMKPINDDCDYDDDDEDDDD